MGIGHQRSDPRFQCLAFSALPLTSQPLSFSTTQLRISAFPCIAELVTPDDEKKCTQFICIPWPDLFKLRHETLFEVRRTPRDSLNLRDHSSSPSACGGRGARVSFQSLQQNERHDRQITRV